MYQLDDLHPKLRDSFIPLEEVSARLDEFCPPERQALFWRDMSALIKPTSKPLIVHKGSDDEQKSA